MSAVTPDTTHARPGSGVPADARDAAGDRRLVTGLAFALLSAVAFSLSGTLASGLFDTGWSPGAVVLVRVAIGALVVLPAGIISLLGRWEAVRRNVGLIAAYGTLAVAGAQFCYFSAVQHMQVGPALLIEYTAPAAVVVWFWLRHGQRPGPVTLVGAGLAALGLVLVLDLLSGAQLSPVGVAWSLGAMVGAATYFVINGDETTGLPPLALAAGGLVVGTLVLGLLGLSGLLPLTASTVPPVYAGTSVPWWLPMIGLGVVTAGVAYVAGIAAGRRLGSRLSSFVSLLEVVAAIGFAWLLLGELPRPVQLLGGLLILAGVVTVRLGEERIARSAAGHGTAAPTS
ncbi:DMT family transporter [Antribacter sp. KLBMP9083]|uniref:DMT family transporter n=1 Tax=Antribacter soli TaxID=2910976 RepID=A0AA41QED2_9MICO|nr:DMT family transporter [Antribacter soli]MCF4121071.1 DMT family transporter [Antribacter soli]